MLLRLISLERTRAYIALLFVRVCLWEASERQWEHMVQGLAFLLLRHGTYRGRLQGMAVAFFCGHFLKRPLM